MKAWRYTLITLLAIGIIAGIIYLWMALPVISAYGAKNLCSCVFVAGRDAGDVINGELNYSLIKYGSFEIDREEKSATGSVFGLAKRKAIFREKIGCTLLNDIPKEELLQQPYKSIEKPYLQPDSNATFLLIYDSLKNNELQQIVEAAFSDNRYGPFEGSRGIVVVQHGQLIAEYYREGFDATTPQLGWSMTKSVTNALIGIMVKKGLVQLNDSSLFADWSEDQRASITVDDLLQMSSGLEWEEKYGGVSTATKMLFKSANTGQYALKQPLEHEPGTHWYYSSGTTNILSLLIKNKLSQQEYFELPHKELFNKLGMHSAVIEPDASGTYVGSSFMYATPRDWAKFGLLYLNDGQWGDQQILPENWVAYSSTPVPASNGEYGAHFWLNVNNVRYPDVPSNVIIMSGFQGQGVFIFPDEDLVVVRLGFDPEEDFDFNAFLYDVIKAL